MPAAPGPDSPDHIAQVPGTPTASAPSRAHFPAATPANTPQLTHHANSTITAVHATSAQPRNAAITPTTSATSAGRASACDAAIAPFAARGRSERASRVEVMEPRAVPREDLRDEL